jgi:DNA-binding NarL/FixJ family response regulator
MKTRPQTPNAPGKRRIFLVEDHPVTRQGLALLLNQEADLAVCGQAGTVNAAMAGIAVSKPDLVMVDIALPGRDGIELIKEVANLRPGLPMLVLSTLDEAIYAERALRASAKGYIMKEEPVDLLLLAIRQVLDGKVYLSETMRSNLFQKSLGRSGSAPKGVLGLGVEQLTDRELEVFRLIGKGVGTRQIAKDLGVSISTVETHRTNIKQKLGVLRAPDLVRQAVAWLHEQEFKR